MKKTLLLALTLALLAPALPGSDGGCAYAQSERNINDMLESAWMGVSAGAYEDALYIVKQVLIIDSENEEALEIKALCELGLGIDSQGDIQGDYDNACEAMTIQALREFIDKYPGTQHAELAQWRIDDMILWQNAQAVNTIEAYKAYLEQSSIILYEDEAEEKIAELQDEAEWQACASSSSVADIESYLSRHPDTDHRDEANYLIQLNSAEQYFRNGNVAAGLDAYAKADAYRTLTGTYAAHYSELKEEKLYDDVLASEDPVEIFDYLQAHTDDAKHHDSVSDHYALVLSNQLNAYSTQADYNQIMAFARSVSTKSIVTARIAEAKDARRAERSQQRQANRHNLLRGRARMGWTMLTLDTNLDNVAVGTQFLYRIGRHSDILNFIFGVGYTYQGIVDTENAGRYNESYSLARLTHQIVVPAKLHINMGKRGPGAKFFIGGGVEWALNLNSMSSNINDNCLCVRPELGVAGKHCEWSIFYKHYFDRYRIAKSEPWNESGIDHRIGTSLTFFF